MHRYVKEIHGETRGGTGKSRSLPCVIFAYPWRRMKGSVAGARKTSPRRKFLLPIRCLLTVVNVAVTGTKTLQAVVELGM